MLTDDFKNFVRKVQRTLDDNGVSPFDTYQLLNIADALYVAPVQMTEHERLVQICLNDDGHTISRYTDPADSRVLDRSILDYVANGKKIDAIIRLRRLTDIAGDKAGLKEAKDAVEDRRVSVF